MFDTNHRIGKFVSEHTASVPDADFRPESDTSLAAIDASESRRITTVAAAQTAAHTADSELASGPAAVDDDGVAGDQRSCG